MLGPETRDNEDIFVCPDGFWCFRSEFSEVMRDCPKSDDFETVPYGTDKWFEIDYD